MVEHTTPDMGTLAGDLQQLFDRWGDAEEKKRIPDLIPMLIDASMREPAMGEVVQAVLEERRRPIRTVLRLAQARGEIVEDLDLDNACCSAPSSAPLPTGGSSTAA